MEPWLRPLLARAFTARGTLWLCGREAAVAPGFRLALSTGLGAAWPACAAQGQGRRMTGRQR